jgi:hydroxymethylglutaryl-CoA synthase
MAKSLGISGFATYLPPYRVQLERWCEWTGQPWPKIRAVVGNSFRMRGPRENVYTMAASAVLRLIESYDVDPKSIGYLALGTESSTDNSAGAVIVKGMIDAALRDSGRSEINRNCEVPEFKHACLGGVYAMKAAARYLALDGKKKRAIVVCSDIAEYERGSTGEPTQGAGAVAMLLDSDARLLALDLEHAGSASDYRGPDFRKPFIRYLRQTEPETGHLRDFPVFNGKYSTTCYVDQVLAALDDMFVKQEKDRGDYYRDLHAIFMHRPYARMPETGAALGYLSALARGTDEDRAELRAYAEAAKVEFDALKAEMGSTPRLFALVEERRLNDEVYPLGMEVLRAFRTSKVYDEVITQKMRLGAELMKDVGNLYTAALPGWLAAGIEHALEEGTDLTGREILAIGYGSGDAAEAIPMRVREGWQEQAKRIGFARAFEGAIDLTEAQYDGLHGGRVVEVQEAARDQFVIDRVGNGGGDFDETGIEYYRYLRS